MSGDPRQADAPGERPTPAQPAAGGGDNDWLEVVRQVADSGADVSQLLLLEMRLAALNLRRMVLLALLFLPLAILVWLALSLLPALALYQSSGSAVTAALLFLGIQVAALALLCSVWVRYRRTLALPRTRRQIQALVTEAGYEAQPD